MVLWVLLNGLLGLLFRRLYNYLDPPIPRVSSSVFYSTQPYQPTIIIKAFIQTTISHPYLYNKAG